MGDVRESEALVREKPATRANFDGDKEYRQNRDLFKPCFAVSENLPPFSLFDTQTAYSGKNGTVSLSESGMVTVYRNCSKVFTYGPNDGENFQWAVGKNQASLYEINNQTSGESTRFNAMRGNWQTFDSAGKVIGHSDFHNATFNVSGVKITLPLAGEITPERLDNEYQKLRAVFLEKNYATLPLNDSEMADVMKRLKVNEGFAQTAYRDTEGFLTIGYGTNLQAEGSKELLTAAGINYDEIFAREQSDSPVVLTEPQLENLLRITTLRAVFECRQIFPNFESHPKNVQKVLVDMMFNLGPKTFSTFTEFRRNIQNRDYLKASNSIKSTLYAKQVKGRATENAELLRVER